MRSSVLDMLKLKCVLNIQIKRSEQEDSNLKNNSLQIFKTLSLVHITRWGLINGIFINGIFPAMSINKGCHSHQWLQPSNVSWWALRKLKAEKNTCHLAAIRPQPLPVVSPEENQDVKIQAPDSSGAYQRNDFSEPRLFHLPIYRKALNSLTWDIWFSLTIIVWRSQLPALCCKTPIYPGSSPHLLGAAVSQLSEMLQSLFCPK